MKIPFTHEKIYVSDLSYDEIFQNIEDLGSVMDAHFHIYPIFFVVLNYSGKKNT